MYDPKMTDGVQRDMHHRGVFFFLFLDFMLFPFDVSLNRFVELSTRLNNGTV